VRFLDRTRMSDDSGRLVEVFAHSWWRIDRWFAWFRTPRADRRMIRVGDGTYRARIERRMILTNVPRA